MSVNNSTNMNLPIPGVGTESGPQYAFDVNNCLTLVDAHDHSPGFGVQITPNGLNISSDLTIKNNNLTNIRTSRYSIQPGVLSLPADLGCTYVAGVDLYFNDVNGNQIQITRSGGVAGSPGSISNLTSPASASYSSGAQSFIWQSDANTAANMDFGAAILRNISANSFGLTLSPPSMMSADIAITLPTLPASTKFLTLDSSGNMAASWAPDNTSLQISSNNLQIKPHGVQQAMLATKTVPAQSSAVTVPAGGVGFGQNLDPSGAGIVTSVLATFTTFTITTTGRPVLMGLTASPDAAGQRTQMSIGAGQSAVIKFIRDATNVVINSFFSNSEFTAPGPAVVIDNVAAGTYTYTLQIQVFGGGTLDLSNTAAYIYEI